MRFRGFKITVAVMALASACTTTPVAEPIIPLPVIPEYAKLPHPAGFDLADLRAVLASSAAPVGVRGEFANHCDESFKTLAEATSQRAEQNQGATELVSKDPVGMHWCFYAKISKLQEKLQGDSTWSQRQREVIAAFAFLSPIASAFFSSYHDSRYLRWAAQYYSKISEWVFFKKLSPTPENTFLLTTGKRIELEPWMDIQREETRPLSVFAKYGISFQPSVAGALNPLENSARLPATVPKPGP